jgi:hypothetical protein
MEPDERRRTALSPGGFVIAALWFVTAVAARLIVRRPRE